MLAQDEEHVGAPGFPDPGGVGVDHHAVLHGVVAGGDQPVLALHLHNTHFTGAYLIHALKVAEGGDTDAYGLCGLQDRLGGRYLNGLTVDRNVNHFHS